MGKRLKLSQGELLILLMKFLELLLFGFQTHIQIFKKNVHLSLLEGLERKRRQGGILFVIGKKPPERSEAEKEDFPHNNKGEFWKPKNRFVFFKHTIIFFTALNITFGSQVRPASLAGRFMFM